MTELQQHLDAIGACRVARVWAGDRTPEQAWADCHRLDWLVWWHARTNEDRVPLMRWLCRMWKERTAQYVPAGELRPLACIEATERWCDDPSEENLAALRRARSASYADAAAYAAAAERAQWLESFRAEFACPKISLDAE